MFEINLEDLTIYAPKRGFYDKDLSYAEGEEESIRLYGHYTRNTASLCDAVFYADEQALIHDLEEKLDDLARLKETVRAFLKKKASFKDLKEAIMR